MFHQIYRFFDKLEDHTREELSRFPILYALVGGVATVMFWRGVWHFADTLALENDIFAVLFSGPMSIALSLIVLLVTGLMVSIFVGDRVIISGLKREKKLAEKTEIEVREESIVLADLHTRFDKLESAIEDMKGHIKK